MSGKCLICGRACESGENHLLCLRGLFGSETAPSFAYSIDELNRMAEKLVLSRMSVPGVQAKLSVHVERGMNGADRMTLVGLDGNYILKLPSGMYPELPEAEHFAMMLARDCGIATADFGLVRLANGALAYVTRRMDREDGVKHMEDMCQLTERWTERKYFGSYEQIAKCIGKYSSVPGQDIAVYFDELLFCYLIGNSDMHLKNFSLIREHDGEWHLSKAYDLVPVKTVMPADEDDLALTVNGKNRKLRLGDFRQAADSMRFTPVQFARSLKRVTSAVRAHLDEALARSFLSDDFKLRLGKLVAADLKGLDDA